RAHGRMMPSAKGPDNKPGTQWPGQIQKCAGITVVIICRKKSVDSQVVPQRWRLPENHLGAGSFLEQTEKRYRASAQTDRSPQRKQPPVTLRNIGDDQDRPEQYRAPNDPRRADRVINRAGQRRREVA